MKKDFVRSLRKKIWWEAYKEGFGAKPTKKDLVRSLRRRILCAAYKKGFCSKPTKKDFVQILQRNIFWEAYEEGFCVKPTKKDFLGSLRRRILCKAYEEGFCVKPTKKVFVWSLTITTIILTQILQLRTLGKALLVFSCNSSSIVGPVGRLVGGQQDSRSMLNNLNGISSPKTLIVLH